MLSGMATHGLMAASDDELAGSIMDTHTRLHEHLSALADGELAPSELELAFAALDTESGRLAWQAYQCIGDVLRSEPCGHVLSSHFDARLASRLAREAPPAPSSAPSSAAPATEPAAEAVQILPRSPLAQR